MILQWSTAMYIIKCTYTYSHIYIMLYNDIVCAILYELCVFFCDESVWLYMIICLYMIINDCSICDYMTVHAWPYPFSGSPSIMANDWYLESRTPSLVQLAPIRQCHGKKNPGCNLRWKALRMLLVKFEETGGLERRSFVFSHP